MAGIVLHRPGGGKQDGDPSDRVLNARVVVIVVLTPLPVGRPLVGPTVVQVAHLSRCPVMEPLLIVRVNRLTLWTDRAAFPWADL